MKKNRTSDQVLGDIKQLDIVMESGKVVTFDVDRELRISTDPDRMRRQAMTGHSRYFFWEYQAARVMRVLREKEIELATLEGNRRFSYTRVMKDEDPYTSSAQVEGMVAGDKDVLAARNELTELREHWTILRALASAHDHRAHALRRLLARDQDSTKS